MITVQYYASLRQIAGREEEQFDLSGETTLAKLADIIAATQPKIGEMLKEKKVAVSVNLDIVSLDTVVRDGDEIALLPPFSGGV